MNWNKMNDTLSRFLLEIPVSINDHILQSMFEVSSRKYLFNQTIFRFRRVDFSVEHKTNFVANEQVKSYKTLWKNKQILFD